MPPNKRDGALDMYIELVKEDIINGLKFVANGNLDDEEEKALKCLMNDENIVIRPADKGSGITIVDKDEYVRTVEHDIQNNQETYKKVDSDQTDTVNTKVKRIVKDLYHQGLIDEQIKNYIMPNTYHTRKGIVKANPKVHKKNIPYRTIVSTINHPTQRLAEVAEKELEEHVTNLPSHIKDTTDFLKKVETIKENIPDDFILFTMDVKALYPSIPRQETIKACKEALERRTDQTISTAAVIKMIETVLENSTFSFNNQHYVQTDGTAIGSKLGKNLACTYMGQWEQELLTKSPVKPFTYYRFIDDIFGIWTGTEVELKNFTELANSIHDRIKVEITSSRSDINFLDVHMIANGRTLFTTIFSKPTDKHMYLHKKSDHPHTTKKAIPIGLGIRAKRICSNANYYEENKQQIITNLHKRGYKKKEVKDSMTRVDQMKRNELLEYRKKNKKDNRVPLVITYNRGLPNVQKIVHNRLKVLHRSQRMREVFKDSPVTAFRRDRNLQDILVHSKCRKMFNENSKGTHKCVKQCKICQHMKCGTHHRSICGDMFCFNDSFDCRSSNCVYGIYCKKCNCIIYVGETGTTIYTRFQNHLSVVRNKKNDPISYHFNSDKHSAQDLYIVGIEVLSDNDIHYRKVRESFWIKKLQTIQPNGLNQNGGVGDQTRDL